MNLEEILNSPMAGAILGLLIGGVAGILPMVGYGLSIIGKFLNR